ncbi:hypothetical protein WMF38_17560 [Sorangium sp. So ce118]
MFMFISMFRVTVRLCTSIASARQAQLSSQQANEDRPAAETLAGRR